MHEQTILLGVSAIRKLYLKDAYTQAYNYFVQSSYNNITSLLYALDGEDLIDALQSVKIVILLSRTQLTKKLLNAYPHLITISCFCIGVNQINLAAAAAASAAESLCVAVLNSTFLIHVALLRF